MNIQKLFLTSIISCFIFSSCNSDITPSNQGVFLWDQDKFTPLSFFLGPPDQIPEVTLRELNPQFSINLEGFSPENLVLLSYNSTKQIKNQIPFTLSQSQNTTFDVIVKDFPEPDIYCFILVDPNVDIYQMQHWCFEYNKDSTSVVILDTIQPEKTLSTTLELTTNEVEETNPDTFELEPYPGTEYITPDNVLSLSEITRLGKGYPRKIEYSPDGNKFAVFSSIGVFLYSVTTNEELEYIEANHNDHLFFSPDWKFLVRIEDEINGKIIQVGNGETVKSFSRNKYGNCIFSPDSSRFGIVMKDGSLQVWNVTNWSLINTFRVNKGGVDSYSFTPEGEILITISSYRSLQFWKINDGTLIRTINEYPGLKANHLITPDGQTLITTSSDKIYLTNISDGILLNTLEGNSENGFTIDITPNGDTLVSLSSDEKIRIWSLPDGELITTLSDYSFYHACLKFSPNGKFLATTEYTTLHFYNAPNYSKQFSSIRGHDTTTECVFSPDSKYVGWNTYDTTVRIINTSDGSLHKSFDDYSDQIDFIDFSPDGKFLAAGSDIAINFWNLSNSNFHYKLYRESEFIDSSRFSPQGNLVAFNEGRGIYIYNISNWELIQKFRDFSDHVKEFYFSYDQNKLVTISENKIIQIWNISDGELLETISDNPDAFYSITFSHDQNIAAILSSDLSIKLFNTDNWNLIRELPMTEFPEAHGSITFSPDGNFLASSTADGTIILWKIGDGSLNQIFIGHTDYIVYLDFSPDGKLLASISNDNTIRFWDTSTGQLINSIENWFNSKNLAFSPDGHLLALSSSDEVVYLMGVLE